MPLSGEVTIDQPGPVPTSGGASGIRAAGFDLPLNGRACLSTKSESPGGLASEPVLRLGGFAATLSIASRTPAEQRAKASKTRGLKTPDSRVRFLCMTVP